MIVRETFPAIRDAVAGVLGLVPGLKAYPHEPRSFDALPTATVEMRAFDRSPISLTEDRNDSGAGLGAVLLVTRWDVRIYAPGHDERDDSSLWAAAATVAMFDENEDLGGLLSSTYGVVISAGVTTGERERVELNERELWLWTCTVTVKSIH